MDVIEHAFKSERFELLIVRVFMNCYILVAYIELILNLWSHFYSLILLDLVAKQKV